MLWFYEDDGGRREAGFSDPQSTRGDCVIRSISIGTQIPYRKVADDLLRYSGEKGIPMYLGIDSGIPAPVYSPYLESRGWRKVELEMDLSLFLTMIDEISLTDETYILSLMKVIDGNYYGHMTVIEDGIVRDTNELDLDYSVREIWIQKSRV